MPKDELSMGRNELIVMLAAMLKRCGPQSFTAEEMIASQDEMAARRFMLKIDIKTDAPAGEFGKLTCIDLSVQPVSPVPGTVQ